MPSSTPQILNARLQEVWTWVNKTIFPALRKKNLKQLTHVHIFNQSCASAVREVTFQMRPEGQGVGRVRMGVRVLRQRQAHVQRPGGRKG